MLSAGSSLGDAAAPSSAPPERRKDAATGLTCVLLTGVGGIVGQGILKSLEGTRYRVVGADASECAAALYAVPRGYLVPMAKDPAYVDRLLEICAQENVRYMFPGLDVELPILARAANRFREAGVIVVLSPPDIVDLADDKLATARFLEAHGFPAPRTLDLTDGDPRELGFPLVLKPRRGGSRAQGVYTVSSERELAFRLESVDPANTVAQEHIAGEEFTCGTINFDGRCHGVIVMRRTLRDGDTHKAFVIRDPLIEAQVRSVAEVLKPFGACNFQLRVRDGTPRIFEINPRCSGTTYCKTLAGFNEPLMTLDYLERGKLPSYEIRSIAVFRYWQEIAVEAPRIDLVRQRGWVWDSGRRL